MEERWSLLYKRFAALSFLTGMDKASSYDMSVTFSFDVHGGHEVSVHMYTYDIGDWNRHTYLGPFKTEVEAFNATRDKVCEAEEIVGKEYLDKENA